MKNSDFHRWVHSRNCGVEASCYIEDFRRGNAGIWGLGMNCCMQTIEMLPSGLMAVVDDGDDCRTVFVRPCATSGVRVAAIVELDWSRIDVQGIVAFGGLATIDERRHQACREWLDRHGYRIDTFDAAPACRSPSRSWADCYAGRSGSGTPWRLESRNLDALRRWFRVRHSRCRRPGVRDHRGRSGLAKDPTGCAGCLRSPRSRVVGNSPRPPILRPTGRHPSDLRSSGPRSGASNSPYRSGRRAARSTNSSVGVVTG